MPVNDRDYDQLGNGHVKEDIELLVAKARPTRSTENWTRSE